MLVKTFGATVIGINATIVTVEVNIGKGVQYFLVGLPDNAVKESKQRIEVASFSSPVIVNTQLSNSNKIL
tara:strand:+ start:3169 stop:3378 length:210 start_codon:yes stop_codon:yes gene_type:complete